MAATQNKAPNKARHIVLIVGEVNRYTLRKDHAWLYAQDTAPDSIEHAYSPNGAARYPSKREHTGDAQCTPEGMDADSPCGTCWGCVSNKVQATRVAVATRHCDSLFDKMAAGSITLTVILSPAFDRMGDGIFPEVAGPAVYRDLSEVATRTIRIADSNAAAAFSAGNADSTPPI